MNSTESKTENMKNPENPIELIVTVVVITAVCSVTICTICGWAGFKVNHSKQMLQTSKTIAQTKSSKKQFYGSLKMKICMKFALTFDDMNFFLDNLFCH